MNGNDSTISLASYILTRLVQLGVKSVFGVPGDFQDSPLIDKLEFLDYVEEHPDLDWVGNANELNAAYAADGYARVSKTLACLVTTFGVGELSAHCGVAGMMAERLPLLHIVGTPSTRLQSRKAMLHHTLGNGQFKDFEAMSLKISAQTVQLLSSNGAGEIIDGLLKTALEKCQPVYLGIPTDLIHAKISSKSLSIPLPRSYSFTPSPSSGPPSSPEVEAVLDAIVNMYARATSPVVLVDAGTSRFGLESLARELVKVTGMRYFETAMGKAVLDETDPSYGGCYMGSNSLPAVKSLVEEADFVLWIGAIETDVNTGAFSFNLRKPTVVELHSDCTKIAFATYSSTFSRELLPLFVERVKTLPQKRRSTPVQETLEEASEQRKEAVALLEGQEEASENERWGKETITQKYLWPTVSRFFRDHDIILAESGTSSFGVLDIPYPAKAISLAQVLWGAIGWSVGAALGAAVAAREREEKGRTILFVGDGALQLTLQEIGTVLRQGLTPFLFVLNNDGYEIERQIHGVNAKYNDIQPYNHSLLLDFLAGPPREGQAKKHAFHKVSTRAELEALLANKDFASANVCNLVEIMMPRGDAPRALTNLAQVIARSNAEV